MNACVSAIRILLAALLAGAMTFHAIPAHAANSGWSKILRIAILNGDAAFVEVENTAAQAACGTASNGGRQWAFLVNTTQGKAILNTLLTAHVMRVDVYVEGTGNCETGWSREDILQVHISAP